MDLKTFALKYMPPVMDLAQQTIVYRSRNDAALGFSSFIAGASRVGKPDIADLTLEDRVSADVAICLRFHVPPGKRCLVLQSVTISR